MDKGPWSINTTKGSDSGLTIISDDFTHDVVLYISGDFAEGEDIKYAEWLCNKLNGVPQE